jgi:hypothetical protein
MDVERVFNSWWVSRWKWSVRLIRSGWLFFIVVFLFVFVFFFNFNILFYLIFVYSLGLHSLDCYFLYYLVILFCFWVCSIIIFFHLVFVLDLVLIILIVICLFVFFLIYFKIGNFASLFFRVCLLCVNPSLITRVIGFEF